MRRYNASDPDKSQESGSVSTFQRNDSGIEINDVNGCCIGKLSQEGIKKWSHRLDQLSELRVVALLKRDCDDPADDFQDRIKTDAWEPLALEVVYTPVNEGVKT